MQKSEVRLEALRLAVVGREGWTADKIIPVAESFAGYIMNPEYTQAETAEMRARNEKAIGLAMRKLAEMPPAPVPLRVEDGDALIECQPGEVVEPPFMPRAAEEYASRQPGYVPDEKEIPF